MNKLITLCVVVLTVISLVVSVAGCQQLATGPDTLTAELELTYQETTLEEAGNFLGWTVPVPVYLPEGYRVQRVYLRDGIEVASVKLLISDEAVERKLVTYTVHAGGKPYEARQRYEFQCQMVMSIYYASGVIAPKIPRAEVVSIGTHRGFLTEREEYDSLLWQWKPDPEQEGIFETVLTTGKNISKEDLLRVAESVPAPAPLPNPVLIPGRKLSDQAGAYATTNRSSYLPGEDVVINFTFRNLASETLRAEPFPPEIRILAASSGSRAARLFPHGDETRFLEPGEAVNYTLTWDQCDDNGQPVAYGYYRVELGYVRLDSHPARLDYEPVRLLILPAEGVLEKTIEVNQSQTVNGVTVTLERVELSAEGSRVYAFSTPPDYSLSWASEMNISANGEYSLDGGTVKRTGYHPQVKLDENGVEFIWEGLDPVPRDTEELVFMIEELDFHPKEFSGRPEFQIYEGPWEFRVKLK